MMSFQFGRKIGIQAHWRNRSAIQDRVEDDSRTVSAEGQRAGGHFIEHRAEREQIGTGVQFFPSRLLRRHVSDGAERRAGAGQVLLV